MLIYSLNEEPISENTCAFFKLSEASVEPTNNADEGGDDE